MGRTFELTTRRGNVQRSKGRSAVAAAAYKAGADYYDERDGKLKAYGRKRGVVYNRVFVPTQAPAWAADPEKLWNAAELAERNKDKRAKSEWKENAQTAGELLYTFPWELSAAGREAVTETISRYLVKQHGIAVQACIHQPDREGDSRNWHCHIQMTTRVLTAKGLEKKMAGQNDLKLARRLMRALRAFIARTLNERLGQEGKAHLVHVEHRSFEDRGIPRTPTTHQGPARTNIKRKSRRQVRAAWQQAAADEQDTGAITKMQAPKVRQAFGRQARKPRQAGSTAARVLRNAFRPQACIEDRPIPARQQDNRPAVIERPVAGPYQSGSYSFRRRSAWAGALAPG